MEDKETQLQSYTRDDSRQLTLRFMVMLASFVIIVAGMKAAVTMLVPFLLALFIAVIASPFLFWMQTKKVPIYISIIILSAVMIALGFVAVTFLSGALADFSKSLPMIQEKLQVQLGMFVNWLDSKGIEVPEEMTTKYVKIGSLMQLVSNSISQVTSLFTNGFLIFLTVVFILLEASVFPKKLRYALKLSDHTVEEFSKFTSNVKRYLAIKTITSLITGVLVTILLSVIGVGYPVLWGMLAFLLNFVPNIGSIIAAIPAILVALVQIGLSSAIYVLIGYLIINTVVGNILEPRWMGKGLGLSTLVVFLSLVFWGWILGPIGMLLSVPLTMVFKVILENREETRWLGIILGSEVPESVKEEVESEE